MDMSVRQNVRLHVEDSGGEGRPVILIHGWPMSSAAWTPQVPALKEAGFRVIAYDRRGFGRSEKPDGGYDYDTLAADLDGLIADMGLRDVTLVGFSMGGGEVARYLGNHDHAPIRSVVFASAVTPFLMQGEDNPDGPLSPAMAEEMQAALEEDREEFFDQFTGDFYSSGEELKVSEEERQAAMDLCRQSDPRAALGCMEAWGTTDFRGDLEKVSVPVLILHGDADGIVPLEGSGRRTHEAISGSELVVLKGAPHGCNLSHAEKFNAALIAFLNREPEGGDA